MAAEPTGRECVFQAGRSQRAKVVSRLHIRIKNFQEILPTSYGPNSDIGPHQSPKQAENGVV